MSPEFQSQHGDIIGEIVSETIDVLPEHWDEVVLEMSVDPVRMGDNVALCIRSPKGLKDLILPTEELYEACQKLEMLCHRFQQTWAQAQIHLTRAGEEWDFDARFQYRDPTLE